MEAFYVLVLVHVHVHVFVLVGERSRLGALVSIERFARLDLPEAA
jgi:hypothetical protein